MIAGLSQNTQAPPKSADVDSGPRPPQRERLTTEATRGEPFSRGDHVEIAERLVADLQEQGPTVHSLGSFYQYDSTQGIFGVVGQAALSVRVQEYGGTPVVADGKALHLRASDVSGAIRLAADRIAAPEFFDDATSGMAFADCFVRVTAEGVACEPHSADQRARFCYPFPFDCDAVPVRFLEFLGQVFRDDDDRARKIELIREFFGLALLGKATLFQRALVLHGVGANGKSVLSLVLERCAPPGSVCSIAPQDFGQEYRRAMLAGKTLNIVAELPDTDILDSESWKGVVSGDSMTARAIREAPFSFKPQAAHIYSANRLPGTTDQTHGFWRRLLVVSFNRVFAEAEQDPQLTEKLVTERPQIVAWALAGAQRALARGRYDVPQSVAAAVDEWKKDSDDVLAFVDERTVSLPADASVKDGTPAARLYDSFKQWGHQNGRRPIASNKFGARMAALGHLPTKTMRGRIYLLRVISGGQS